MAVLREYQGRNIGNSLIKEAVVYAKEYGAKTMTVETLAPQECDENYLKTYKFYEKCGFMPLFNLKPTNYEWNMVYMLKIL
jgi:GNAT superfamily N-acetyltransferase